MIVCKDENILCIRGGVGAIREQNLCYPALNHARNSVWERTPETPFRAQVPRGTAARKATGKKYHTDPKRSRG